MVVNSKVDLDGTIPSKIRLRWIKALKLGPLCFSRSKYVRKFIGRISYLLCKVELYNEKILTDLRLAKDKYPLLHVLGKTLERLFHTKISMKKKLEIKSQADNVINTLDSIKKFDALFQGGKNTLKTSTSVTTGSEKYHTKYETPYFLEYIPGSSPPHAILQVGEIPLAPLVLQAAEDLDPQYAQWCEDHWVVLRNGDTLIRDYRVPVKDPILARVKTLTWVEHAITATRRGLVKKSHILKYYKNIWQKDTIAYYRSGVTKIGKELIDFNSFHGTEEAPWTDFEAGQASKHLFGNYSQSRYKKTDLLKKKKEFSPFL